MKDLSHFLLVSDIDDTLLNKYKKIPKANLEAIERFCRSGGRFTLASARSIPALYSHYKRLPDQSTPAIVLNGAGIYDFADEKMLWYNSVPAQGKELAESAMNKFPFLELAVFTPDKIYIVRPRLLSRVMMLFHSLEHISCKSLDEVPEGNWGKVIFFCTPHSRNKVKEYLLSKKREGVKFIDTTALSFDLVNETTNKGTAVRALAGILGVDEKNIGAIGDYFNDYDMLKTVAHPACCAQAPKELHELCEFHACHCNKGAVADFISYIEKTY